MAYRPQTLAIDGFQFSPFSGTETRIFPGIGRDSTNQYDIGSAANIDVDITTNGVNGLDVGASVGNTWYAVHVIDGPTVATAGLLSLSPTAPTLPANYTVFRRVGWVRTSGGNALRSGTNIGNGNQREYFFNNSQINHAILTNGSQTGAYAVISCAGFAPPTARLVQFAAFQDTANSPTIDAQLRPNPFTGAPTGVIVVPGLGTAGALPIVYFYLATDASQQIQYSNTAGGGTTDVRVISYVDQV
jgi:hypothetical protein